MELHLGNATLVAVVTSHIATCGGEDGQMLIFGGLCLGHGPHVAQFGVRDRASVADIGVEILTFLQCLGNVAASLDGGEVGTRHAWLTCTGGVGEQIHVCLVHKQAGAYVGAENIVDARRLEQVLIAVALVA